MKEIYTNAAEAARDIGIEVPTLRFMIQKGLLKSAQAVREKGHKSNRYVIYTRRLCEEVGIPFVEETR